MKQLDFLADLPEHLEEENSLQNQKPFNHYLYHLELFVIIFHHVTSLLNVSGTIM